MKRPDWVWLRDALWFPWGEETLDVFQDNEERLKLHDAKGFTLELQDRLVLRRGRVLGNFDEIEGFVVEQRQDRDLYRLILARLERCDIRIGDTRDQLACSKLAARMSTLTGKPVVARRTVF